MLLGNCSLKFLLAYGGWKGGTIDSFLRFHNACVSEFNALHADRKGRVVYGVLGIRLLKFWGHGFESHIGYGCLLIFIFCINIDTSRFKNLSPKDSYGLFE
jgi:hypothetical protein